MVLLAVRLLYGVARSHGFQQGNKRTGFYAALMFLRINGLELDPTLDSEDLGRKIVAVLEGKAGEEALADTLRPHVRPYAGTSR